ncbi:MAG: peptidoglycan DD-metalloendopeptidase family protein [Endomicrobiales bacterium]|nr:peptidoglycan DD-metalloendopeptidase family protein [Endomicrobiales bacterium]
MKKNKKLLAIFTLLVTFALCAQVRSSGEYDDEIKNKNSSLSQIKDTINQKKSEQKIIKKEEDVLRKELKRIQKQFDASAKKIFVLNRKIVIAQANLRQAESQVNQASQEKAMWGSSLNSAALFWQENFFTPKTLFKQIASQEVVLSQLAKDKSELVGASIREKKYQQTCLQWQSAKKTLAVLKEEQQGTLDQIEITKKQRQEILSTTTGKRIEAEEEIKRLTQSSKELESLISKLDNARRASAKKNKEVLKVAKAYALLPWPISGSIVVKFGKNKHPQLDTYIISNGIKIKSKNDILVKAVANGQVMFAGEFRAYGKMIVVDNGGSLYTIYGGFDSISVQEGSKVKGAQEIGLLKKSDPILYFEVRLDNKPQDPVLWLKQ